ncbi:MAG: hypothetical protein AB7O46_00185 [Xanthobacteraceae bacterium]
MSTAEKIAAEVEKLALSYDLGLAPSTHRAFAKHCGLHVASLLQQGEPEGALRKAYNKIEQHMFDYTHETHSYDASTNAWECSNGEVVAYVEGLDKALEIIKPLLSTSPLPPAPGAETGAKPDFEHVQKLREKRPSGESGYTDALWTLHDKLTDLKERDAVREAISVMTSSSRQAVLEEADYFASLVSRARAAATKATAKFPQPNYVTLKIAEEAGEVVRGCVHYAEKRMEWSEVEGEIVQLLAMLIRLVTEGDQVNGVISPLATTPPAEGETK